MTTAAAVDLRDVTLAYGNFVAVKDVFFDGRLLATKPQG